METAQGSSADYRIMTMLMQVISLIFQERNSLMLCVCWKHIQVLVQNQHRKYQHGGITDASLLHKQHLKVLVSVKIHFYWDGTSLCESSDILTGSIFCHYSPIQRHLDPFFPLFFAVVLQVYRPQHGVTVQMLSSRLLLLLLLHLHQRDHQVIFI